MVLAAVERDGFGLIDAARTDAADVIARLGSSETGLTASEAGRRLGVYGPNAIRNYGASPVSILWRQLTEPAADPALRGDAHFVRSRERTDAIIILGIIGLSVGLGFFDEYRCERAVEAPRASIRHRALILRDGHPVTVGVTEVVPGDVALLRTGDLVPVDLRLLKVRKLECDDAVLTGEAMPTTTRPEPAHGEDLVELGLKSMPRLVTTPPTSAGERIVDQSRQHAEPEACAARSDGSRDG